ncbi:integrase catalytic domain-containing protein [Nephila pilipes]|uniref:Integrase catalytic domain-containing protein n=1 Tax=Nephila pilipes TaxID=299642 RepID=A0A8X6R0P7_NEPPI|nr:integrase catalytic domain-containing protein [Nephila pilipes]
METDKNINKLQRKRSTLRSKVTRLTGKLNDADGIDKAFDVELLGDTLKDLKLMNEAIHDLLNDEDYERDTADCEKYFDTANLSLVDKHVFLRGYLDGEAKRLVDGISVIGDTYETTKKLLEEDKYGNKNRIIQSHLDYLENLKPVQDPSPMELNDLYIECNRTLQALNALGENTEAYGRILAPKIIRAFPTEICCRWIIYAKREKLAEGNITRLMQFLAEEVEGHWPQNCETVTDYKTRVQKLKSSNRCFLCTNRGHRITNCPHESTARCIKCKKQHHVSICPPRNTQLLITHSEVNHINIPRTIFTHLQTACLYVTGPTGITKLTRCILDGGSQASFVDVKLIDELKLNVINSSSLRVQAFESSFTQEQRRCVQLTLSAESPIKLSDSFVMIHSMLGWILSGSRTHTTITDNTFVHQFSVQISNDCLNDRVRCLCELDSIRIQTNKEFHKSTTAVLGIDWDTNDDTLGNAFKTYFCVAGDKPLTKRWLLRCIASCYDPLGLFSPFTIIVKISFQDTWILGIKWDELLPTNLSTMWTTEILQYTSPAQWRYCPGTKNPTDHLSRGILPSKLSNLKNWWYGPDWLTQEPSLWPTEDLSSYEQLKTDNEARKPLTQSLYVETTNPVIDITHYSSYTKLLRVTAWILHFLHNCRNEQRFQFELTAEG